MAKEKKDKKEKKEKKIKKEKADSDLHDTSPIPVLAKDAGVKKEKSKKEKKKDKKVKAESVTTALLNQLEEQKPGSVALDADGDVVVADVNGVGDEDAIDAFLVPDSALVPFANPLADEKQTKKVLKSVKKAQKHKTLKRGVKEVVKSLRKSPTSLPSSSSTTDPLGVVILAGDISPMDVISHIPVLCEDVNIPYIYVKSRAELGAAGNTKRPTSVVLISRDRPVRKLKEEESTDAAEAEYRELFGELVKLVNKAGRSVRR